MSTHAYDAWIAVLEASCARVGVTQLDLIVDQAGSRSTLIPTVCAVDPPLLWRSLFDGLPEAGIIEVAPLLIRIDLSSPQQRLWLSGLLRSLLVPAQVLVLVSRWPFGALGDYLGRCLEIENGGELALLRYYDPRLFALLFSHVLTPEQQPQLIAPAMFWSWLDRDLDPQYLAGSHGVPVPMAEFCPLVLTDGQVERLEGASDAMVSLQRLSQLFKTALSVERGFQACYSAVLEATRAGILTDPARTEFVLKKAIAALKEGKK